MLAVNVHSTNVASRNEWEGILEKEGNVKKKKICLINLVAESLLRLSLRKHERVKVARKSSQALGTCSVKIFKAVTRASLISNNVKATEDFSLA